MTDEFAEAAALDAEIRARVTARAMIPGGHTAVPPQAAEARFIADNMLWHVRAAKDKPAVELSLYHSGLGWVSVQLSRAQAEDLQTALTLAAADLPPVINLATS